MKDKEHYEDAILWLWEGLDIILKDLICLHEDPLEIKDDLDHIYFQLRTQVGNLYSDIENQNET